ncbi:MAG: hypothetical protein H7836_08070 [Magnetococcus sp. YQC-3]
METLINGSEKFKKHIENLIKTLERLPKETLGYFGKGVIKNPGIIKNIIIHNNLICEYDVTGYQGFKTIFVKDGIIENGDSPAIILTSGTLGYFRDGKNFKNEHIKNGNIYRTVFYKEINLM